MAFVYHMVWSLPSCFWWTSLCVIGWTIPHGSTQIELSPEAWNLTQCCFIFLHNTDANMLHGLFDDHKYMDIYLLIHQEYSYLGKQKISLSFSTSTCEHLWPSHLVNCTKCSHNPSKDAADWSVVADFKSLLNFNFFVWKSGTQKLHQGLSETILVNNLTDVRELKIKRKSFVFPEITQDALHEYKPFTIDMFLLNIQRFKLQKRSKT